MLLRLYSALFARRQHDKRLESLKFEPPEIERLRDIPKVDQLADWWKQPRPGYVENPPEASFFRNSLRLQLAHHGTELGPVDPAKIRSAASIDERRLLREKRGQLADKVTHITHQMPEDYAHIAADAVATRAPDLHPQERVRVMRIPQSGDASSHMNDLELCQRVSGVASPEPVWALPISPIKVPAKVSYHG
ncbi:unnamed protein product [Phytophthora lilii]|uniref:Unnamed protein product n=1 Tax=Phytophthora lilii TaxID=2077276 RepID=A0A9W6X9U7_9STRA|nr:unnamed protein product [Phytophthora lilii]